jgi:hypothetical protein
MKFTRMIGALALAMMLSSCFYGPGRFTSALDIRKDGSFAFSYTGEILFTMPDEMGRSGKVAWSDDMARCTKENPDADSDLDIPEDRPCTAKEIAEQRKTWEVEQVVKAKEEEKKAAEFGAVFGYTPGDDAANKRLAETMMRYEGWKSVVYKGNGVFDVVYEAKARLDHDFLFPLLPQNTMILPFVTIRRLNGNMVRVTAPAYVANPGRSMMAGMKGMGPGGPDDEKLGKGRTSGSFTVTTDAMIRTNNTEYGPETKGGEHKLVWQVSPTSTTPPEALIDLK